ncbi:MAG TPA: hypothetical protein VIM99_02010 [Blastocatellia bacterium]
MDVVTPQPLRVLPIDESHPEIVALMRGPVMYVGLNPWDGLSETPLALPSALNPINGRPDSYVMSVEGRELVFATYFKVEMESHNAYFRKA